ncbi:autoinducer binding domain-containing protein [Asticcacaulis sp. SL142]|uniref:helix-turn-helix transcriptional regulator n=1 Tax=Asticcacaulis sp. SL142 TaxID=2995155 RepID=UPI00226D1F1B|nr:autoinducer binding domain-containing protein [Asticcacaulis sp. SL142]WAC46936.1 autoinducer binding domain-containing protein [Asticcacaulis sp. SL142]
MLHKTGTHRFEDFIADTARAATADELFGTFTSAMHRFGYDQVNFSIPRDLDLPPEHNRSSIFVSYPEDWQKYYVEKDVARIDPVLRAAATHHWGFLWSDLEKQNALTKTQISLFRMAEDAGLNNGIGIPFKGSRAQIAGVALASRERSNACLKNLDLISAYCTQFYAAYKRLYARSETQTFAVLTPKEEEILLWVASGKTDEDIASILTISRNTVDTHMRHIFRKLDVTNRVQAVVKAVMAGIIHP